MEDESKILQPEEIKTFLDAAKNTRYYELFYIILNTGMRIGEITALAGLILILNVIEFVYIKH